MKAFLKPAHWLAEQVGTEAAFYETGGTERRCFGMLGNTRF